jgi:hypothetical protein
MLNKNSATKSKIFLQLFIPIFLAAAFFVFGQSVLAYDLDNFDSYTSGSILNGQGNWISNGSCYSPIGVIDNSVSVSSPNSALFRYEDYSSCDRNALPPDFKSVSQGEIDFKMKVVTSFGTLCIARDYPSFNPICLTVADNTAYLVESNQSTLASAALGDQATWHLFRLGWDTSVNRVRFDPGSGVWSDWFTPVSTIQPPDSIYVRNSRNQISLDDLQIFDYSNPATYFSNLGQFKSDGATPISDGATITDDTAVFKGTLAAPAVATAKLQIEVQPLNAPFTAVPSAVSSLVASGQTASVIIPGLADGSYHWQARAVDSQGNVSVWQTSDIAQNFTINHAPTVSILTLDNFDSYTSGSTLNGQGNWVSNGSCYSPIGVISNSASISSPNSALFFWEDYSSCDRNALPPDFKSVSRGEIDFRMKVAISFGTLCIARDYPSFNPICLTVSDNTAHLVESNMSTLAAFKFDNQAVWHLFRLGWDTSTNQVRFDPGSGVWSDWFSPISTIQPPDSIYVQNSRNQISLDDLQIFDYSNPAVYFSNLGQFKVDGKTPISDGATITDDAAMFKGTLVAPAGTAARLQIEVQPFNAPFTAVPSANSNLVSSGQVAAVTIPGLANGQYHWQVRAVDSQGNVSAWQVAQNFTINHAPTVSVLTLDNFDSYTSGTALNGQGNWVSNNSCDSPTGIISNTFSVSSPNSALFYWLDYNSCNRNVISPDFRSVSQGEIDFKMKVVTSFGSLCIPRDNGGGYPLSNPICLTVSNNTANLIESNQSTLASASLSNQAGWHLFRLGWDTSANRVRFDPGSGVWSDWFSPVSTIQPPDSIYIYNVRNQLYLDDLQIFDYTHPLLALTNLKQLSSDGVTIINEGASVTGNTVVFQGTLVGAANNSAQLQVEVQPVGTAFTGTPTATSVFSSTWGIVSVSVPNLSSGQYHWQARVVDSQNNASDWQEFGTAGNVDFTIARYPVIIVPGIMGSYLSDSSNGQQVWLNLAGYALPGEDGDLRKLEFFPLGGSVENLMVDNAIEKVLTEDFYSGLIKELEKDGYKEGTSLFVFPYDWRYSIDCLAGTTECPDQEIGNLDAEIGRVLTSTGSKKVDIVAHSMGGLITKAYIEKFGTSTIDKLITIATPNLGSPKTSKILLYGDNLDICILGECILNEATVKEISQNIPSIYQLLPSQKYFDSAGSYISDVYDIDNNGIKGNLNYQDTNNFLTNTGRNGYLLANAVMLHNKIDNLQVKDSFSISGCGTPTIDKIYILNKEKSGGYEYALNYTSGDRTVPLASADYFGAQKYYVHPADHGKISSSNGVKQLVGAILNNGQSSFDFSQYQNVSTGAGGCSLSGTQISYHSPVTLSAYDQDGNHVGRTADGDVEVNIPGAQYDEIEGNKFIYLPSGGNYTITGQATASGSFNARVETVESGQYTKESYFNEVPLVGTSTKVEMAVGDNQEAYTIKVDQNGDGSNVKEITPDAILTGDKMNDLAKPVTNVNVAGAAGNNGYYTSNVKVDFTATDDNSGVLKTEYSLDNGKTWSNYVGVLTIAQDGITTIIYSSTDKAGNREENKTTTVKIDQTKPTISMLLPQEGQEVTHDEKLDIAYFADDNFSGIATSTAKIYLDGQVISSNTIDLFKQSLGAHQIKITIQDLAGNQTEQTVNFSVITDIDGTIADVDRAYAEKMITNNDAKKGLIDDLNDIKAYQERYGQKTQREKALRDKAMAQCLKHKNQAWCTKKIGTIFDRFEYQLNKIDQALIKLKYSLILTKLDVYLKTKWLNQAGYNIIKEDIKYLISKL